MAFDNTRERYTSFGVATSLSHDLINTIWDILDNYLKGVVSLDEQLTFHLIKNGNKLSIQYVDDNSNISIVFDYMVTFDPFFPRTIYLIDESGIETILLPYEL
ncbi:DUF960 domain-containing protein [Streptococcus sciuri]|uniref:DUF960 domain-containing protein n=1 Tax=Streptococcus sciuri TaxID=2973939 RepID=A0ABT2F7L0_9STRE|nr:DUF960 domain-containing protein [Streptococcus sciuri]MCS4488021.1 DUF960 domain-containing protein [Streptococcus sciuri]